MIGTPDVKPDVPIHDDERVQLSLESTESAVPGRPSLPRHHPAEVGPIPDQHRWADRLPRDTRPGDDRYAVICISF